MISDMCEVPKLPIQNRAVTLAYQTTCTRAGGMFGDYKPGHLSNQFSTESM